MKKASAQAKPTKSLIIDHLTADIDLSDAIVDLIDNSIDGIRRSDKNNPNWHNYTVKVSFDSKRFEIEDNCGGMDAALARDYAFRFGRPSDRPPEHGLLGVYGVGMKRAVLKMGDYFRITSRTATSAFEIKKDLKEWKLDEFDWEFEFETFEESTKTNANEIGTKIEVTKLFEGVYQEFQDPLFEAELIKTTAKAHRAAVSSGLRITINEKPVQTAGFSLLSSAAIRPAYYEKTYNGVAPLVRVVLYAGITDSRPKEAGWYVFCNGRMVVEADQSTKTVWGETGDTTIPKIHNQFSRFRGYAFFDSDDQKRLPWTSTKSGINLSSDIYRKVRLKMIELTRPIISFLNDLDKENEAESRPRTDALKAAHATPLNDLESTAAFFNYSGNQQTGDGIVRISFQRPKIQIEAAKEVLGVTSNKEVGESVFDYWYKYEVGGR